MMTLRTASKILKTDYQGKDLSFTSVNIDSRTVKAGELFIAIKGERFDGHDFIAMAAAKGAVAALVSKPVEAALPILRVADTVQALGQLAAFHRTQFNIPVFAITGSCGKTTTKTMLAAILAQCGAVLSPLASFNNAIGLPLTLLRLTKEHQYAVLEVGANHFGEITYLIQIAKPTTAAITNIGPVHLEGFQNLDGVAKAKGEIFENLAPDGVAIINADDPYAGYLKSILSQQKSITFGLTANAQIQGHSVQVDAGGYASFVLEINSCEIPPNPPFSKGGILVSLPLKKGENNIVPPFEKGGLGGISRRRQNPERNNSDESSISVKLPMLGEHHVMNALAAAAAAHSIGIPLSAIKQGLESTSTVPKRLIKHKGLAGSVVIDDSYNANLVAAKAALQVLARTSGEKLFILGDMSELGSEVEEHHTKLGEYARSLNINHLFAVGVYSALTVTAFGKGAKHFANKQQLITAVQSLLHPHLTVLVKGSRKARMEEVVAAIIEPIPETGVPT